MPEDARGLWRLLERITRLEDVIRANDLHAEDCQVTDSRRVNALCGINITARPCTCWVGPQ